MLAEKAELARKAVIEVTNNSLLNIFTPEQKMPDYTKSAGNLFFPVIST
jgi:hypothetical protein